MIEKVEVVLTLADTFLVNGVPMRVRICGRPTSTVWEGWIEFIDPDAEVLRTPRETTQPDRRALEYWATGISPTYLEGAFVRATARAEEPALADFDEVGPGAKGLRPVEGAVLNPFSVGAKGVELLRSELSALSGWHLRNIVRAYELADPQEDLEWLSEVELVDLIVDAVMPA